MSQDPRNVTLDGIVPIIPISKRLVPTDVTTPFRAYMTAVLDRLAVLLRTLYNTTPDRVRSISYQRKIDGRDAVYRLLGRDVNNNPLDLVRRANSWNTILNSGEQELFLLYNKLLVIENEDWVRTIGRLSVESVNRQTDTFETSIKEVNLQDILFLQYGYDLAVGSTSTFLPWRIVSQTIRFRSLATSPAFVIPNTQGLTVNWLVDTLEIQYGAYQNMALSFAGSNVVVYRSEIIRQTKVLRNEFVNLLTRAVNAWNGDTRTSIEAYQYKLGLQYDYLANPDQVLENQLRTKAVNPQLRVVAVDARQTRLVALQAEEDLRRQQIAMDLEFNPEQLLYRELTETIRRTTVILENDSELLREEELELQSLLQEDESNWEPEEQNRAIQLRRDIARLRSNIQEALSLISQKEGDLSRLESVSAFVQSNIQERVADRRLVTTTIDRNRNSTINVDNTPIYIDEGLGTVLQGASSLNLNQPQVLIQGNINEGF
jgi:hypothetical protein